MKPNGLNRRDFLRTTMAAAAVSSIVTTDTPASEPQHKINRKRSEGLTDTNVTVGQWPFRRLPLDETPTLVSRLRKANITQAWAGIFDGLLHKDISSANARLAESCRAHGKGMLLPFGCVNLNLPGWKEDLRRCHEVHNMRGLRLYPNYNGYKLSDPVFASLLDEVHKRSMVLQIALAMEDERTQHPLMQVPHVDPAPLLSLLEKSPVRVVLLNWWRAVKSDLRKLAGTGKVSFDIATVENVGGVENLLKSVPAKQIVFGSQAPLFYIESALLKLRESELDQPTLQDITWQNAALLLGSQS